MKGGPSTYAPKRHAARDRNRKEFEENKTDAADAAGPAPQICAFADMINENTILKQGTA